MAINAGKYRNTINNNKGGGGGKFWRPEDRTKTHVRIFTFKHVFTNQDVVLGRCLKNDVGDETEEVATEVRTHFTTPPTICSRMIKSQCDMCDDAEESGDKRAQAKIAWAANVVVTSGDDLGIKLWNMPSTVMEAVIDYLEDEEVGNIFNHKGRDLTIDFDKSREPAKMYKVTLRDREYSKELPATIQSVDLMLDENLVPNGFKLAGAPVKDKSTKGKKSEEVSEDDIPFEDSPKETKKPESKKKGSTPSGLVGKVVVFDSDGDSVRGVVTKADGNKLVVKDEEGLLWKAKTEDIENIEE